MEKSGKGLSAVFLAGEGFPKDASLPERSKELTAEEEHRCKDAAWAEMRAAYDGEKKSSGRKLACAS